MWTVWSLLRCCSSERFKVSHGSRNWVAGLFFQDVGDLEYFRRCGLKGLLWRLTVRKSSDVEELGSSGG